MNIQQFLEHHGIVRNPFAEEDAQTDPVFKEFCISRTYHPAWDKIYGNPQDPSTSIVFGEKGSGKTALRLQIVRHIEEHNAANPAARLFVIEYDDFNPFLDRFRSRLSHRQQRSDRVLTQWKLWDHMDAILSLGVTQLVDWILQSRQHSAVTPPEERLKIENLDRLQARDLLLLAACYDQSASETFHGRWSRLRRRLRFWTTLAHWPLALGILITLAVFGFIASIQQWTWLAEPWPYLFAALGWLPWLWQAWSRFRLAWGVRRQLRVVNHEVNPLRRV